MTKDTASPILTLCATELQARMLRAQYQREQAAANRSAWESPPILSLSRWVRQQWLQSWPEEELISRSKERWLWQELIRADVCHSRLLAPDALADQLMRVWRTCQQWLLDPFAEPRWTDEQELYARLHRTFGEELARRHWITDAQLAQIVLQRLVGGSDPAPERIRSWGFRTANLNRIERSLLQALGIDAGFDQLNPTPSAPTCRYESPAAMWAGLAAQIHTALEQHAEARVIVAVPQLSQHIDLIDVHWTPQFAPQVLDAEAGDEELLPWAIEHPLPLGSYPVVGALVDLCALAPQGMDFLCLSNVLRQPLFYRPEERIDVARAEQKLREWGLRFDAKDLHAALDDSANDALKLRLTRLTACVEQEPRTASGSDWVAHWQQRWQALPLADANAHWGIREDLQQALAGFVSLADEMGVLTRHGALATLRSVLQDHLHSPRVAHDVRIVICDSTQAANLPCTHLYAVNLDARHYPAPRPTIPWLNPELLLVADHPQATPHHWLTRQRQLLAALSCSPQTAGLMFAEQDESGTPQSHTPLLDLGWAATSSQSQGPEAETLALQWPESDPVPPMSPARLSQQKGGSSLVRRQSASPFAAFLYHRLGGQELPSVPVGLSPARQGEWVHAVLASFWSQWRHSRALAEMSDEDLIHHVQRLIEHTRGRYLPLTRYGAALQALEADRVLRLCTRWLQHERKRIEPFEVLHCEAPFRTERVGLPLKLRLDRLDCVHTEFGKRYLVIDYKTGQADMNGWRGEVLREPQLPLYATSPAREALDVASIDGICFARVHEFQPALLAATNWCRKLTEDSPSDKEWKYIWDEELQQWERQLDAVIQQYRDGEIRHRLQTDLNRDFGLRAAAFLVDAQDTDDEDLSA